MSAVGWDDTRFSEWKVPRGTWMDGIPESSLPIRYGRAASQYLAYYIHVTRGPRSLISATVPFVYHEIRHQLWRRAR